jgi:tRNA splicing ligase
MRRDELDTEKDADSSINEVITLDIQASVIENLETVLAGLRLDTKVTKQDIHEALLKAESHLETTRKIIKNGLGIDEKKKKLPAFYGVKVMPNFFEQLEAGLKLVDRDDVFSLISNAKGANREWHMTIVYRAAKDHALLKKYDAEYMEGKVEDGQGMLESKVSLKSSRVVMNDRIIALEIEETALLSINKYRHITLAILKEGAKALESNTIIENLHLCKNLESVESFALKLDIDGEVQAFL